MKLIFIEETADIPALFSPVTVISHRGIAVLVVNESTRPHGIFATLSRLGELPGIPDRDSGTRQINT